jgi:hypothetical protein
MHIHSYAVLMDFPLVFRPSLVAKGKLPFIFDKVSQELHRTVVNDAHISAAAAV